MKKLALPESQMQEILYELINRLSIDRKTMMLSCGVWNLTARISNLRKKGLNIKSDEIKAVNKYGRDISFVHYRLEDKKEASAIYNEMKANQRPKVCSNPFYDFDNCEVKVKAGCLGCEWYETR